MYASPVDVLLAYRRGGHVLLARREGTGYADDLWNLPSGKLEEGEDVASAMRREAREELGIALARHDLRNTSLVHWRSPEGQGRVGVVFDVTADPHRHGVPRNAEPAKCGGIDWFPFADLPPDTVDYSVACLRALIGRRTLVTAGW